MSTNTKVNPKEVHSILDKHILTDGLDMVLDLEKSEGVYLYDSRGEKRYLDFFTFFASNPLGMNHPRLSNDEFIRKIGKAAVNKPSNSDVYTEAMAEFVDNFDRIGIPDYMPYAFFISGGALAVENALKVAFDWKVQKNFEKGYRQEKGHKVLHLEKAFHGRSGYTLSLTNTLPNKTKYFPKFDWPRIVNPVMKFPATDEHVRQAVDLEGKAIAQAERYFEMYKDEIACIILEPIQGEGGDNHFRLEFHQALRDLADKHEALLIYDEVQTGVGLTGKFWAHEHYVKPDILAFGKKAQVCGILSNDRVDDIETNCFHVSSRINSTWGGNLVDMVRFGRILEVIEEEKLVENAAEVGSYLQDKLSELAEEFEHFSNPRGKGLFCAIDLPNGHARDAVKKQCIENQLMILACGERTIRFRPPLNVKKEHVDEAISIMQKSYKEAAGKCPALTSNSYTLPNGNSGS
ncbi:L-lysine 6-transaminase [Balneolaceae bacterium YR4-1]|uniref:L-lysine-epsilon aminotransferase n=1 Tax=Halalkalibaculum roseum TaxID=2709311 RepID=A0A6M1SVV8_9BACT|nr:L-lysine 6-transaminase [Halalkalibaculum roseum]NGP77032.1 L-lysine 6-transaminase [Halalkalibaculum roseum]